VPVGHKKQVEKPGMRCVIGVFYLLNPIKWCKQISRKKEKKRKKEFFYLRKWRFSCCLALLNLIRFIQTGQDFWMK
jgi:hypothetical protein